MPDTPHTLTDETDETLSSVSTIRLLVELGRRHTVRRVGQAIFDTGVTLSGVASGIEVVASGLRAIGIGISFPVSRESHLTLVTTDELQRQLREE